MCCLIAAGGVSTKRMRIGSMPTDCHKIVAASLETVPNAHTIHQTRSSPIKILNPEKAF